MELGLSGLSVVRELHDTHADHKTEKRLLRPNKAFLRDTSINALICGSVWASRNEFNKLHEL